MRHLSINAHLRIIVHYLLIISFSLCCVSIYSGQCQENTGYLHGKVVSNRTGEPVAVALLFLIDKGGKQTDFGAFTNTGGFYFIPGIHKGQYSIQCSMMGYENYLTDVIEIIPGDTLVVNISMKESSLDSPQYHMWPYPWSDRDPPPDSTRARLHALNPFRTELEGRVTVFKSEFGLPIEPVPNASLCAIDSSGTSVMTASSNLQGYFIFRNLPPGTYQVRATAEGFLPSMNDAIPVESGWIVVVPVSLHRKR